jgi:hypothetical protein
MGIRLFSAVMVAAFSAALAPAQGPAPDSAPNQVGDDPPSRAARLSLVSGTVSFEPASVEDWVPATLNRPLTTGDRLWTEAGARAELNLGSAALRLNGRTNFTFINLSDNMTQVQVSTGTLSVRLRRLDDQESFEIDTPQVAFSLLRPGEYRVDVNEQGDATLITVRGGQGEASADNQVMAVHPRQQMRVTESGDGHPVFDERDAPVGDGFDNFCMDRDRREDRSESARHVSRDMPGYADLDEHGVWREDAQYGWIWAPRVEVGWAPYHHGHWAWIAPWGWTWVDDAPWGYAPFHYGRWAFVGAAWVWVPGPPAVRPAYAPALVAWVGGPRFGVGISVGVGVAAVGWFPLGPGEVWTPAYRASPRYFTQVNVSNTVVNRNVNITNVYNNTYVNKTVNVSNVTYANQGVNGAVMAVPQNAMGNGRPVAQAAVRLQASEVASAQVQQGPMVAPQRAAVLSGAAPAAATPPAAVMNRSVVARATPPPAPVPFSQQQSVLQANPGQPLARTQLNQIRRASGINPAGANTQSAAPARPIYRQAMPTRAQAGQTPSNPQFNPRVNPASNSLSSPGAPSSQGPLGLTQTNPQGQAQQNQNGRVNSIQPNVNQPKPGTLSPEAARPVTHSSQAQVSPTSKTPPPHQTKRPAKPDEKRNEKKRADQ